MSDTNGLGLILGLGIIIGMMTAVWSLMTGGTIVLALLGYSFGGTSGCLLAAIYVATAPEPSSTRAISN